MKLGLRLQNLEFAQQLLKSVDFLEVVAHEHRLDENFDWSRLVGQVQIVELEGWSEEVNWAAPTGMGLAERARVVAEHVQQVVHAPYVLAPAGVRNSPLDSAEQFTRYWTQHPVQGAKLLLENGSFQEDGDEALARLPEDVALLLRRLGAPFCLNLTHVFAVAGAFRVDFWVLLREFLKLQPIHFRVSTALLQLLYEKRPPRLISSQDLDHFRDELDVNPQDEVFTKLREWLPTDAYIGLEIPDHILFALPEIEKVRNILR